MLSSKGLTLFIILGFTFPTAARPEPVFYGNPERSQAALVQARNFFSIYLTSLLLIDPMLTDRFRLNTPGDIDIIKDDIQSANQSRQSLCNIECDCIPTSSTLPSTLDQFDKYVIPALFKYQMQHGELPTEDVLRKFYERNLKHYPQVPSVTAAEIVIGNSGGQDTSKTVSTVNDRLSAGENFYQVARDYYASIGIETSGILGHITPNSVPEWKFGLFLNSDSGQSYFGPVVTPEGILFGKASDPITSEGGSMYTSYREQILIDYQREMAKHKLGLYLTTETERLRPEVYSFDPMVSDTLKQPAFSIGDQTITFEECRKRLPHISGNIKQQEFWHSLTRQCLNDELILQSVEINKIKALPEYEYLKSAWTSKALAYRCLLKKRATARPDENTLRQYYENKKVLWKRPDQAVLTAFKIPYQSSSAGTNNKEREKEFQLVKQLRKRFAESPTSHTAEQLKNSHPNLQISTVGPISVNQMDRVLTLGIEGLDVGDVSEVLIENGAFSFVHIVSFIKGKSPEFQDISTEIRKAWLNDMEVAREVWNLVL